MCIRDSGGTRLEVTGATEGTEVRLYDYTGQLLLSSTEHALDISALPDVYKRQILYFAEVMSLILSADSYEVNTCFIIVKGGAGRFPIIVTSRTHVYMGCVFKIRRKSSNNLDTTPHQATT